MTKKVFNALSTTTVYVQVKKIAALLENGRFLSSCSRLYIVPTTKSPWNPKTQLCRRLYNNIRPVIKCLKDISQQGKGKLLNILCIDLRFESSIIS